MTETLHRYADVAGVLADRRFGVPAAEVCGDAGTLAWLRATASRFANGATHERRRALVTAELSRLDPAVLRAQAYDRAVAAARDGVPVADLGGRVPAAVLARGLGVAETDLPDAVAAVATLAPGYLTGGDGLDAAVAALCRLLGPATPERLAGRIALLAQAYPSTAALIGSAVRHPGWPVPPLLTEVLRHDPPVRATRRVAYESMVVGAAELAAGDVLVLDLAAANRDSAAYAEPARFDPGRRGGPAPLTFGVGFRACPGATHALALATGVVEAIRALAR